MLFFSKNEPIIESRKLIVIFRRAVRWVVRIWEVWIPALADATVV